MKGQRSLSLACGLMLLSTCGAVAAKDQKDSTVDTDFPPNMYLVSDENFQPHMYMGLGVGFADAELSFSSGSGVEKSTIHSTLLGVHLGYQFHNNFAVEFRGYGNLEDDDIEGYPAAVDKYFAILGKGMFPVNDFFKPYVVLGTGRIDLSIDGESDSDNDFVYGVGFTVNNGNPIELEVEWMRIYDGHQSADFAGTNYRFNEKVNSIHLNLIYHFPASGR